LTVGNRTRDFKTYGQ